jgi:hypothetical protein
MRKSIKLLAITLGALVLVCALVVSASLSKVWGGSA